MPDRMAFLQPTGPATPPTAIRVQSTVPSGQTKLRDSCHVCATSKVKCDKMKPLCGRCEKRGTPCHYVATKRAGRKRETRTNDRTKTGNFNAAQPPPPPTNSSLSSEAGDLMSPAMSTFENERAMFPDFSITIPQNTLATPLTGSFDDFFDSLVDVPSTEAPDDTQMLSPFSSHGFPNMPLSEDVFSVVATNPKVAAALTSPPPRVSKSNPVPTSIFQSSRASPRASQSHHHHHQPAEPLCCCLGRALTLLQQLTPEAGTAHDRARPNDEPSAYQRPTLHTILAENKRTTAAVMKMLQCSCSRDGYLLSIISLIIFKTLGWYQSSAREPAVSERGRSPSHSVTDHGRQCCCTGPLSPPSSTTASDPSECEDQRRMALQLILGELHRIQKVINYFAQRLKAHNESKEMAGTGEDASIDWAKASPFSSTTQDQLETDLRKRLRLLSVEIIHALREE